MPAFTAIFKSAIDPNAIGDALLPLDPALLPAGISYDPATNSFAFDPNTPSYIALADGQTSSVTINFAAADGTPGAVELTLIGVNDAPIVSGPVTGLFVNEGGAAGSYDLTALLAPAHDPDSRDKLRVLVDPSSLPASVTFATTPEHIIPGSIIAAHTIAAGPRATPWGNYVYPVTYVPETIIPDHIVPETTILSIDPNAAEFQSLAQGDELQVVVNYQITDGIAVTDAQAIFTVNGMNDAPIIAGPVTATTNEGGAVVTINALTNARDIDHGSVLTLVAAPAPIAPVPTTLTGEARDAAEQQAAIARATQLPGTEFDATTLPPGVSFDAANNSFALDPTDPAYRWLAQGQTATVTVNYGVSDGIATTAAQAVFTVIGVNQAPIVSGPATGVSVLEDGAAGAYDRAALLANASDIDLRDILGVRVDPTQLPDGVTYHHADATTATVTTDFFWYGIHTLIVSTVNVPEVDTITIDPTNAAFQSLAAGETLDVIANYAVTDGIASTPAQAIFHIVGTNDAPTISGPATGAATEDGAVGTIDGLAMAHDVDHGSVLTIVAAPVASSVETAPGGNGADPAAPLPPILSFDPTTLPAGVTFDAANNAFTIDPTNAAYQYLSAGQLAHVVVNYGVSDGIVATAAQAVFTVVGTNDAPVVSGPVSGLFVNEDGAGGTYDLPALLSTAHDVDANDRLSVIFDPADLPDGVTYVSTPEHITPGYTIPAHVIPAGPRGTSWGAYVYPAQYIPAIVVPDQLTPATSALAIDPSNSAFQSLAQGEERAVIVHYKISDGTVSVDAQAIFTVNGMNDAPIVTGPIVDNATEDGAIVSLDALANAHDVDHGSVLTVVAAPVAVVPIITAGESAKDIAEATALAAAAPPAIVAFNAANLPAGVSYDAGTHRFSVDPANAAFQSLGVGQTRTITIDYGVSDGITVTAARAVFTVTGTNDAPLVSSPQSFAVTAGSAPIIFDPLANVTDIDSPDVLSIVPGTIAYGVHSVVVPGGYYQPSTLITQFFPNDPAFRSLAQGETTVVTWNYDVTDGHSIVHDSAIFTVTGVNDAPVITAPNFAATTEAGAAVSIDALANAIDYDHGAVLSVVNVPATLPTGISYNAATHRFSLDPTNPIFQTLAQGQVGTYTVAYGVSDGMVTTATTATFNVTGVNNATVISGPAFGTANEGGAIANIDARINATDIDTPIEQLRVVNLTTTLPAGVTFNAATQKFFLDPTNAAYRTLSVGETTNVVIPYSLTDGYAVVATSAVFTVTGKNNAPIVSAAVNGGTVLASGASVTLNLLANASDVDHLDTLNVNQTVGSGPTATVVSGTWSAPIAFSLANNQISLNPTQFANLALGKTIGISFSYQVTDGNPGGTVAATANLSVQGVYAGPTGVAVTQQTGSLGKLLGGSGLNAKALVANLVETGGIATDSYSYTLGGTGAASFAIGSASGVVQLLTGNSGPVGAAGGQLYALSIATTDTSAGLTAAATPLDVVVGLGRGSNIINLASLPGMTPSTPTFIYDLGGSDTINGAGMTGRLSFDGGQGADVMTGGSGANTYLYGATTDSTANAMDIITNFHASADMLDFTGLGSKFTSVAALANSATSIAGGAIGWQASGGNVFVYANTSGNSQALTAAAMKIELAGAISLTSNNFAHL